MYIRNSYKFGKQIKIINAGEYYVSKNDELIGTLLGSCVAVCLHDSVSMISGMNHFMLPGRISRVDIFQDRSAKYGIIAIRELITAMKKNGAKHKHLSAKIFGGGNVMELERKTHTIPEDNVRLAKILLEIEDIPIFEVDSHGPYTRKLLMDVKTGKVYLKKTKNREILLQVNRQNGTHIEGAMKQNG